MTEKKRAQRVSNNACKKEKRNTIFIPSVLQFFPVPSDSHWGTQRRPAAEPKRRGHRRPAGDADRGGVDCHGRHGRARHTRVVGGAKAAVTAPALAPPAFDRFKLGLPVVYAFCELGVLVLTAPLRNLKLDCLELKTEVGELRLVLSNIFLAMRWRSRVTLARLSLRLSYEWLRKVLQFIHMSL